MSDQVPDLLGAWSDTTITLERGPGFAESWLCPGTCHGEMASGRTLGNDPVRPGLSEATKKKTRPGFACRFFLAAVIASS